MRLRDRDVGLQLEYRLIGRLELFLTGFQSSNRFLVGDRPGLTSSPTFKDVQALVGGRFASKIAHALRLSLEAGATVHRDLAVETADDEELESTSSNVSPYVSPRFEFRP